MEHRWRDTFVSWNASNRDGLEELPQSTVAPASRILVIACSDPSLDRILGQLEDLSVRVWRSPGARVSPGTELDGELLSTSLGFLEIREVIILGHSHCSSHRHAGETGKRGPGTGMAGMVQRIREADGHRLQAMNGVLEQMGVLRRHPALARAVREGAIRLRGWLHLDESGTILEYDSQTGHFVSPEGETLLR